MLSRKAQLNQLIEKYIAYKHDGRLDLTSEETNCKQKILPILQR